MVRVVRLVAILLACGVAFVGVAAAHQPTEALEGRMMALPDATQSWSIDGRLERAGDVDWFRFPAPERLLVQPLVRASPDQVDLAVSAAVIARGLPAPLPGALPDGVVLAPGEGALVVAGTAPGERLCHFGFCWLAFGEVARAGLEGPVTVAVWSEAPRVDYTLAVGTRESSPPAAPVYLRDPAPGEPASAVPASSASGEAATPGFLEFLAGNAFATNAEGWLPLVVFGAPSIAVIVAAAIVARAWRRRRAGRLAAGAR